MLLLLKHLPFSLDSLPLPTATALLPLVALLHSLVSRNVFKTCVAVATLLVAPRIDSQPCRLVQAGAVKLTCTLGCTVTRCTAFCCCLLLCCRSRRRRRRCCLFLVRPLPLQALLPVPALLPVLCLTGHRAVARLQGCAHVGGQVRVSIPQHQAAVLLPDSLSSLHSLACSTRAANAYQCTCQAAQITGLPTCWQAAHFLKRMPAGASTPHQLQRCGARRRARRGVAGAAGQVAAAAWLALLGLSLPLPAVHAALCCACCCACCAARSVSSSCGAQQLTSWLSWGTCKQDSKRGLATHAIPTACPWGPSRRMR